MMKLLFLEIFSSSSFSSSTLYCVSLILFNFLFFISDSQRL